LVHQNNKSSTTKLWRLCPWRLVQPATTGHTQVNLLALLLLPIQEQGNLASTGDEVPYRREIHRSLANSNQPKSTSRVFLHVATERNDTPTVSYYKRRQWKPLPHGLLVLSSSKPLTGRTGHYRLRDASVYWNHWRYTLDIQESLPLPDKDSSHDDMPCWTPLH